MVSFIGKNILPNGRGLIPPKKVISGGYRTIIGNGSGLFTRSMSVSALNCDRDLVSQLLYNGVMTQAAIDTPHIREINSLSYAQVEPSTENSDYRSQEIEIWSGSRLSTLIDQINDPLGYQTVEKSYENDTATGNYNYNRNQGSLVSGQTVYYSIWIRPVERYIIQFDFGLTAYGTTRQYQYNMQTETELLSSGIDDVWINKILVDGEYFYNFNFLVTPSASGTGIFYIFFADGANNRVHAGIVGYGMYIWGFYTNIDAKHYSSHIITTGSAVTKPPDNLWWNSGDVPTWLQNGFELKFIPHFSSSQWDSNDKYLFSLGNEAAYLKLVDDSGYKLKLSDGTNTVSSSALTWDFEDIITVQCYPSESRIVVSGATTGNGEQSGSALTLPSSVNAYLGSGYNGSSYVEHMSGLISVPVGL